MNDLDRIDESLAALVNHFGAQNKSFMVAWFLVDGEDLSHNVMCTEIDANDMGRGLLEWAGALGNFIHEDDDKPWGKINPNS